MRLTYAWLLFGILILGSVTVSSCTGGKDVSGDSIESVKILTQPYPKFNKDSAYSFLKTQVAFGPRVPGTAAHKACANWIQAQLKKYCDTTYRQESKAKAFNGDVLPIINLIGSINPQSTNRVLLCAHWDTRPFGDMDPDSGKHQMPIPGANDGGSGVAVLLELARIFNEKKPEVGIDFIFFDTEDYGKSEVPNSFCLGSQFWAKNTHVPDYKARYGILLDMVGAKNAEFYWEANSQNWAPALLGHVWSAGQELGYEKYFRNIATGGITDDHQYVYEGTKIPIIDIIQFHPSQGFASTWHTHADNLEGIDPNTLEAVGQTLSAVMFNQPTEVRN